MSLVTLPPLMVYTVLETLYPRIATCSDWLSPSVRAAEPRCSECQNRTQKKDGPGRNKTETLADKYALRIYITDELEEQASCWRRGRCLAGHHAAQSGEASLPLPDQRVWSQIQQAAVVCKERRVSRETFSSCASLRLMWAATLGGDRVYT